MWMVREVLTEKVTLEGGFWEESRQRDPPGGQCWVEHEVRIWSSIGKIKDGRRPHT